MQNILKDTPKLRKHLYEKGFFITNSEINVQDYPFYNNWNIRKIDNYNIYTHNSTRIYCYSTSKSTLFLIGHAYNPFSLDYDEMVILNKLSSFNNDKHFYDYLNELTGVFFLGRIEQNNVEFLVDASGMQYCCYGTINKNVYISSHMRLIGDIANVSEDFFVKKLINYRWYRYLMGNYLPGDLTCYNEIKRVIPNTKVKYINNQYNVERFYPNETIIPCKTEDEYNSVIDAAAKILQNTMELIPKKWQRPAISLTGGIDSGTTFAAANGNYDKYETFSYVALEREKIDSIKAKQISNKFNVKHTEYLIPLNNEEIKNFDAYKKILKRNGGDIGPIKDNDTRKKICLINCDVCDVEIKSWVSETSRAYAYKYFGKKKFRKSLSPRNYTSLYKLFLFNRKLVWKTDKAFKEYLQKYKLKENLLGRDETDFFVWEMMHGGKCGLDIGVMRSCFDIDIPYNNRKLLDLLLRIPLSYRISDKHHLDLRKNLNKDFFDMNIRVVNANQSSKRAKILGLYYSLNSFFPF